MIKNCYDLLSYINEHNGCLHFPNSPEKELGISRDTFDMYIDKLNSFGYINKYIRSCGITAEGKDFLNNNLNP